jgi:cellulose synthase/poly-beta-1,6-N-acetylglucosamine synthase-like glycosyltransferase
MVMIAFWSAIAAVSYVYVGFPLLVMARGLVPRAYHPGTVYPTVSVLVAARNEEEVIAARIENLLASDYPREQLEIIFASDASDDGTDAIVRGYEGSNVRLFSLPRGGKAVALNTVAPRAAGEVLVFTDANTVFAPGTIAALVRPFADPAIGGVAGDQRYLSEGQRPGAAAGERSYWSLDRLLKRAQSRAGSVISATGALYAVRRVLYEPIPHAVMDDFFVSTGVIAQGQRLVFEEDAVCYETAAPSASLEFGRKVRIITQGLRAVWARRALLNVRRTGFYAVQLFSHKVLRRLAFVPLAALAVTAPLLWTHGALYRSAAVAQGLLYVAAGVGALWARWGDAATLPRVLSLPLYFGMVNVACLVSVINLLRGRRIDRWEPQRAEVRPNG